ncbi:MAG: ASCH domain-containing protein [Candidatus Peregrinibacteria bacterium]|nr:ASCH domain-containing protein [Candidatus Peregrinibacteria bacterium]
MKSIAFTVLYEKLKSREKTQTYRVLYIPTYEIGEIVKIDFKHEDGRRETLYQVRISDIYPKQVKDLTLEETKKDGFDTINEFQATILKMHHLKSKNRWGFIIRWEDVLEITSFLGE